MKNIASLVLNYSTLLGGGRSSRVNGRTLRVRNCKALALCALLLFAVSCKKDSKDEPSPAPQSITGNVSTPSWAVSDDYDMTSSMTVIASVDLSLTYADQVQSTGWTVEEDDLLAAFDGNQCIGLRDGSVQRFGSDAQVLLGEAQEPLRAQGCLPLPQRQMPWHRRRTLHPGLCLRSVTAGFVCIFLIFLQRIINLIPTKAH